MQTIGDVELERVQRLLPDSALQLIDVLGWPATARLISAFGGATLSAKSGVRAERSGGVHKLLRSVLTEDESKALTRYLGGAPFYIPRCDQALRALRNARFLSELHQQQDTGHSIRQSLALLCPRYGISDRYAWRLIRERYNSQLLKSPTQVGLFD
ncbi:mor transcription activator family protein [Salmonella enterica]|nr:mor transcription activator family protein [Salmonella enterica]EEJ2343790.1 mor transcription activator family protein [Salmonella enterica subsp. enterica serovar Oslo]EHC3792714.1 mor transcription activator family protein [Salmonella enterica subsp. enterica serovar Panama]EBF0075682.1 mor transcription activator family protein [Salmonella enterica]EBP5354412.1 mor transcription activator family protein [Salmonella enterica]